MNIIKYLNPKTGEKRSVRVTQAREEKRCYPITPWPWEADRTMFRQGFVRCGLRKGKPRFVRQARAA